MESPAVGVVHIFLVLCAYRKEGDKHFLEVASPVWLGIERGDLWVVPWCIEPLQYGLV